MKKTDQEAFLNQTLAGVNDGCADALREFYQFDAESSSQTLSRMWEGGRMIEELKKPEYARPIDDEDGPVNVIAIAGRLTGKSPSMLNKMGQLYRMFPTAAMRDEMLNTKLSDGRQVTYAHWSALMPLYSQKGDTAAFDRMCREMIKSSLSPEEIEQRVTTQRALNGITAHAGGKPIKVPVSARGRIALLIADAAGMNRKCEQIYAHAQHNILSSVRAMDQDAIAKDAEALLDELTRAQGNIRLVVDNLNTRVSIDIAAAIRHVRQCATDRITEDGATEADELEEADAMLVG